MQLSERLAKKAHAVLKSSVKLVLDTIEKKSIEKEVHTKKCLVGDSTDLLRIGSALHL